MNFKARVYAMIALCSLQTIYEWSKTQQMNICSSVKQFMSLFLGWNGVTHMLGQELIYLNLFEGHSRGPLFV